MPPIAIVSFRDDDGSAPFLDWFDRLPAKAKLKCRARLRLLADHGHDLRRPAADYLRDGIYELRAKAGRVQYRILYCFQGRMAVVILHAIMKAGAVVPAMEIDRALRRKRTFEHNPRFHTHEEML